MCITNWLFFLRDTSHPHRSTFVKTSHWNKIGLSLQFVALLHSGSFNYVNVYAIADQDSIILEIFRDIPLTPPQLERRSGFSRVSLK